MAKYLDYLYKFEQSELRGYLGEDVIELLVEWIPNGDTLLTKQRMISMIDSLYGGSILKQRAFRTSLLSSMNETDIYDIRDNCLKGVDKCEHDPIRLIEIIANKPWNKNELSLYLAKLWEVPESIFDKEIDDSTVNNTINSSEERFYELLDYQYYIKQRVLNNLNSGYMLERMLIHMPTGTGKTKTSMHIVTNYIEFSLHKKGIVIWIAHTIELLQQAYNTFVDVWEHLGDGELTAYKMWGKHTIETMDIPLNGMVFCGLEKLMSIHDNNPVLFERLHQDCRLIIFDEAHKAAASKTKKVIENLMRMPSGYENRALIGLSATPGRTTEDSYDNNLLTNMFGGKLVHIDADILNQINMGRLAALNLVAEDNIIKYFQERRILSRIKPRQLVYKHEFTEAELEILGGTLRSLGFDEREYTDDQLKVLATNKERNLAIMTQLRELYIQKTPTIVFACSVRHAQMLSAMLTLEEIPNSLVIGEMNEMDRKRAIDDFKNKTSGVDIIINYEVLTTGFDSKNIKCVFITRPTKSIVLYSQMLGRGLRGPLMGGNEECLLIDVDDNLQCFDNETAFSHFNDYWRV
ncbi:MAG: DEAD/DEAH box helicase family protein [Lachnospiraceae bacterium]|nr:DEAD/DEAH box helicase family protein [Lachnospiraceae bacterium]